MIQAGDNRIKIYDMQTEHLASPNAVDKRYPRLSWKIESEERGVRQVSYRIQAWERAQKLWDSGEVVSAQQQVCYGGEALGSRMEVSWSVDVVCENEAGIRMTAESDVCSFCMGLLDQEDWKASWISPVTKQGEAACLRKSFFVNGKVKSAVIYQSAHGLYEFYLNGRCGCADKFKPGLTSYYDRIQYQRYDVTDLLTQGENVWAVRLADGWWRGTTGGTLSNNFGYELAYLGQLEITYFDGRRQTILSDESFSYARGGLLASDMMMGDIYDAALEPENWMLPGFPEVGWKKAILCSEHSKGRLIASAGSPIREMEHFSAKEFRDSKEARILDFGQNIAGYTRCLFRKTRKGQKIHLIYGEDINAWGEFDNSQIADTPGGFPRFQEITYLCKGAEEESYQPDFAVFGFRYMKIEGYEEAILEGDMTAIAVYSDLNYQGEFRCSNPLINQLVSNSRWSQKGNFLDVATDCPTRERNAWTGDAQIYAPTAVCFADAYPFYEKWLIDQKIEQYESGKVGMTFPSTSSPHDSRTLLARGEKSETNALAGPTGNGNIGEDSSGWGDAAVWIPYVLYRNSGDLQILRNQYETAKRYVEYEIACAKERNPRYTEASYYKNHTDGILDGDFIYDTHFHYGEWCEWTGKESIREKQTPLLSSEEKEAYIQKKKEMVAMFVNYTASVGNSLVATAYLRRSSLNLAEMAEILGYKEDAEKYKVYSKRVKTMYDRYLIAEDGSIQPGHQAAYVRALAFDLVSEEKKPLVIKKLLEEIHANGDKLNTGFLSTPFLLPVLADCGESELAYQILENEELPGWLNPVLHGATTISENWDGFKNHVASLNHYSYGSVCEFLFRYCGGIRLSEKIPGYREFVIKPVTGGSLTWAEAKLLTPYGSIKSHWEKDPTSGRITYRLQIPVGTTARVCLEDGREMILGSGSYEF